MARRHSGRVGRADKGHSNRKRRYRVGHMRCIEKSRCSRLDLGRVLEGGVGEMGVCLYNGWRCHSVGVGKSCTACKHKQSRGRGFRNPNTVFARLPGLAGCSGCVGG